MNTKTINIQVLALLGDAVYSLYIREKLIKEGINDSNKIKFEDEQGNIQEKSWNDLTEEEKLNILKTPNVKQTDPSEASNYGLDDSETALINYLR